MPIHKRSLSVAAISALLLALAMLFASNVTRPATSIGAESTVVTAQQARSVQSLKAKKFFKPCKRSKRFWEHRVGFGVNAKMAGRCVTSKRQGVKRVSSYAGHHPSAGKALDIMINLNGSCYQGREAGNKVARYFMNNAKKHRVYYIIWKNGYWNANSKPTPPRNWRKSGGGSCTTRHYDHVHVAFK